MVSTMRARDLGEIGWLNPETEYQGRYGTPADRRPQLPGQPRLTGPVIRHGLADRLLIGLIEILMLADQASTRVGHDRLPACHFGRPCQWASALEPASKAAPGVAIPPASLG
ncbi:hypothetical protein ACH4PR_25300 [Streptomyces mirabilis]|uniref:hypothetical protein n=1 Tax=Streptomyces mirabilis TaxID=68239 RepID=UPI0037AE513C